MLRSVVMAACLGAAAVPAAALTWHFEIVDSGPGIGSHSSIAVGPADQLHLAYFDGSHGYTKYAYREGLQWHTEIADGQYLSGHYTSIKIDTSGKPHMVYRFYSGHNLRYGSRDGVWSHGDFETDNDMEADCCLALDSLDRPHVAYWDGEFQGEPHDLKHAFFDGVSWSAEIVDSPGDVGRCAAIALDSHGYPHISYYDQTGVTLKHAAWDGSRWRVTVVDNVEFIGFNFRTAIAVDSRDRVHIVYSAYHYQAPDWYGRLKYAIFDGSAWTVQVVDQSLPNRDFRVPALAIDPQDQPHASYLIYYNVEPITADMKYATFDGLSWHTEFVDTGDIADSDYSNGICLDSAGRVHIGYSRSGSLIHAYSDAPAGTEGPLASRPSSGPILAPPWPNPCSGSTNLTFTLPRASEVVLDLVDAGGRRVASVARGWYGEGVHSLALAGPDAPGLYFCRLQAGGGCATAKLVVR
jgi:hypothetical protein